MYRIVLVVLLTICCFHNVHAIDKSLSASVRISTQENIQKVVDSHPAGTVFNPRIRHSPPAFYRTECGAHPSQGRRDFPR